MDSSIPLAEQMRPTDIKDMVGQEHLLGKDSIVAQLLKSRRPFNAILWGPPGTGKTTLARIMARELAGDFIELSAVTAGLADVRSVIKRAEENRRLATATILFVDEIHRFNKAQQDAFLPHVESGLVTLIGATTENPSFEVIAPLLSRSRVLVLKPLDKKQMVTLLKKAAKSTHVNKRISAKAYELLADLAEGDARVALGNLDIVLTISSGSITPQIIKQAVQRKAPRYDKNGENHYDIISAFIKSIRGSNAHAACYYLARMLQAGEDPKFIARRLVILASEDIGIASSPALNLAISTFQAVERIGMPECQYNLFHCVIVLAAAKKSRVVADAMAASLAAAKAYPDLAVPKHLRNAPTKLMKELGYGEGYQRYVENDNLHTFLPPEISDFSIY